MAEDSLVFNFGISDEYDLYEKLKYDLEILLTQANTQTKITIYNTFNFLVTAWHLHWDWTKANKYSTKKNALPENFKNLLTAIRFLANSSKHRKITNKLNENVIQEVSKPNISNFRDYVYGEQITIKINHQQESLSELSTPLMDYFDWLLDDNKNIHELPDSVKFFSLLSRSHFPSGNADK